MKLSNGPFQPSDKMARGCFPEKVLTDRKARQKKWKQNLKTELKKKKSKANTKANTKLTQSKKANTKLTQN